MCLFLFVIVTIYIVFIIYLMYVCLNRNYAKIQIHLNTLTFNHTNYNNFYYTAQFQQDVQMDGSDTFYDHQCLLFHSLELHRSSN